MPDLTIFKTVTYPDPVSGSPYTMTARVVIVCEDAQRTKYHLSTGSNTKIWENNRPGLTTANPQYTNIKNIGENSAYLFFDDTTNVFLHELKAGADFDFFGEHVLGDDAYTSNEELSQVYAKGDTQLEVDVFM